MSAHPAQRAGSRRSQRRPGGPTRRGGPRDRGAVTAELAVALPAAVLVLGACVGALQLSAAQVRLQDVAALSARAVGRGDAPIDAGLALPDAVVTIWREEGMACARASGSVRWIPALPAALLAAESCALADGR